MSGASTSSKINSSRELVPFVTNDISSLAKSLRAMIEAHDAAPTQVQMLNWLAKSAGYRNYQSLRAAKSGVVTSPAFEVALGAKKETTPANPTTAPTSATAPALSPHAAKALTQFDADGRLHKWPHKFAVQRIAMWGLWLRFDAKKHYTEKEINSVLKAWHTFGDHATLRRELVNMKLLAREADCSEYWKVAQQPSDEIKVFLRTLRATRA